MQIADLENANDLSNIQSQAVTFAVNNVELEAVDSF
jgi:hypothetical protein